jgi:hypothetical protein
MANTLNRKCVSQTNIELTEEQIASLSSRVNFDENITYAVQPRGYMTLSRFISALLTLDPEVIDFKRTNDQGLLQLKDTYSLMAVEHTVNNNNESNNRKIEASIAENFNKANLGYYSNLFSNMSEIYGYVQNLLFVFVSMFFIGKVGFDKGLRALDKSKESGGDTQWLSKFYVPVLTVGFFFAPIPEEAGMSATMVQKMIRFMVTESTAIADQASAVIVNTYMKRLYSTVGAMNAKGEQDIKKTLLSAQQQIPIYNATLSGNGVCKQQFPHTSSFVGSSQRAVEYYKTIDSNDVSGNLSLQPVTFEACRVIEYRMMVQEEVARTNQIYLDKINSAYNNGDLVATITRVNALFQQQQNQLGWTNVLIIPSASIMVESLSLVRNASLVSGSNLTLGGTLSNFMENENFAKMSGIINEETGAKGGNQTDIGYMMGNFAYMVLPGSAGMYRAFEKNPKEAMAISKFLPNSKGEPPAPTTGLADKKTYLLATSKIYEWMISNIPIVVSVIAGIIAYIGYVVELSKFFYISPFVTAFALTTKKAYKIVDFMVLGLVVFFRPLLIAIFVGFAMFINILIQDIFLYYALNQFAVLHDMAQGEPAVEAVISLVSVMLHILGSLGAMYIMWKLILTGPVWTMKLVGVDSAQNDIVSEALSQRMDRAAFRM